MSKMCALEAMYLIAEFVEEPLGVRTEPEALAEHLGMSYDGETMEGILQAFINERVA